MNLLKGVSFFRPPEEALPGNDSEWYWKLEMIREFTLFRGFIRSISILCVGCDIHHGY